MSHPSQRHPGVAHLIAIPIATAILVVSMAGLSRAPSPDDSAAVARIDAAVDAGELDAWKATLVIDLLRRLEDPSQRYLEVHDRFDREVAAGRMSRADALRELIDLRRSLWGGERTPRALHRPAPDLDLETRRRGPAEVVVRLVVEPDGRVDKAVVARSSDPAFEAATLRAVRRWRFAPAVEDGVFTSARMQVPIRFPAPAE